MAIPAAKSEASMKHLDPSSQKVRVVLRVRPFLPSEIATADTGKIPIMTPCITLLNPDHHISEEVTVHLKDQFTSRNVCYKLDSFFGQDDHVGELFRQEVRSVFPVIFQGRNATVFTYGATGSGKTYTMQGTKEEPGIMPLAMSAILSWCENTDCLLEVSYYEVYMDKCYDLLEPKAGEIMTMDDREGRLQLKGLSSVAVHSMEEFFEVFSTGTQRRKVAHTGLNDASSRSHGVLSIVVTSGSVRGKLNLIDLAGNEDNRRTCNEGIRLQESAKINQSLFALSNVIYALNNNEPRIPYRESKLTRILQDSLGGTSHTLMIACLNPSLYQEAVHTVSLAARSRCVVNYVGSASKRQTPKEKIGMEAKLRAWLESKGKMRSVQRVNGPFSPQMGRTPISLDCTRNLGSVRSSVKVHADNRVISSTTGRKLFDPLALVAVRMEVADPPKVMRLEEKDDSSSIPEEMDSKECGISLNPSNQLDILMKFPEQITCYKKEERRTSGTGILDSGDLPGTSFLKENLPTPIATGSPIINQKIQEQQKSSRKVLSPVSSNMTTTNYLPSDDRTYPALLDPKTPKNPNAIFYDGDEVGKTWTPLNKFNTLSSHLKESLVQEYLTFLNVASREELLELKGIGQKRAEYILKVREESPEPFKTLADLEKIGLSSRQVHDMFRRMAKGIFT